jgi:hypothetical protein
MVTKLMIIELVLNILILEGKVVEVEEVDLGHHHIEDREIQILNLVHLKTRNIELL